MTSDERKNEVRKKLRSFWVAGAAGAFFSGLAHNLPADLHMRTLSPDWPYTRALFLRYGYVCWLLIYFFISSIGIEEDKRHPWRAIFFDILQSIFALIAAAYLGFVTRTTDPGIAGYLAANLTILVISGAAWLLFHSWSTKRVNALRLCAVALATISIALAAAHLPPASLSWLLIVLQAAQWVVLMLFLVIRLNEAPASSSSSDHQATVAPAKLPAPPVVTAEKAKPQPSQNESAPKADEKALPVKGEPAITPVLRPAPPDAPSA